MKTITILPAGQFAKAFAALCNTSQFTLIGFGDNSPKLWNTHISDIPVYSVEKLVALQSDAMLIAVIDDERTNALKKQAMDLGYQGEFYYLKDLYHLLDIRSATLCKLAPRLKNVAGDIAELGVYQGEFARKLNLLFPKRSLYLFDTFEGFVEADVKVEQDANYSFAALHDFSDTNIDLVMKKMPYPDMVHIKKGIFPETSHGLEDKKFALVSLDADLYAPLYSGLSFFYPRLTKGGMIILHDYNNSRFRGAKHAVEDYESQNGKLLLLPLCDLHGSAVIIHP